MRAGAPGEVALLDAPWQGATPGAGAEGAGLPWATLKVLLTWRTPVGADLLARAPDLQLVLRIGPNRPAGLVDAAAARRLGIYAASLPDYAPEWWAARCLAALREVWPAGGLVPKGRGGRLGIVGLGAVGRRVAQEARRTLGCAVFAHDPFAPEEAFAFNDVLPAAGLDELCGLSHALVVLVPGLPCTRGLVGARQLALLPAGAGLVHFGGAEVVAPAALAAGLAAGRPACAVSARPLELAHPRLQAGVVGDEFPPETHAALQARVEAAVRSFLAGQRPPHLLIDPPNPRQEQAHYGGAVSAGGNAGTGTGQTAGG